MADDSTLTDAFGPLDPVWVADDASDPTVRYLDVRVTQLYRDHLYGKPRGVQVDQGTAGAKIRSSLFAHGTGAPLVIDVGQYSTAPTVEARYVEASGLARGYIDAAGTLSSDGRTVVIDLPDEVSDLAGIHTLQFRVMDANGLERARNEVWVFVDRGAWTTSGGSPNDHGPPTTRELRGVTRDHPGANRLLGEYEFDVAELAQAVVSATLDFQATFPQIPVRTPTTRIPPAWRRAFMDGALAHLFSTAADYHRRGALPYSAGGMSVNDLGKTSEYIQAAEMYRERFAKWARFVKTQSSLLAGFGSTGSGYPGCATF